MTRTKSEQIIFDEKLKSFYEISGNEYICKKCRNNIRSKRERHYETCKGGTLQELKNNILLNKYNYSQLCDMGCGQISQFFYKNGKAYCCKFGAKCPIKVTKDIALKKGINPWIHLPDGHPRGFEGKTPWNKGLTKETNEKVKQMGEIISNSFKLNGDQRKKTHHTNESKLLIKSAINARYASGWQATSCGRAKSYPYDNPSEGIVHLTGTWEVALATALDKANIKWLRNKKRFDYIKPNGEAATYLPDFYLPTSHLFLECKGYQTPLDVAKWTQFNEPLIILRKKEIFQIKKWLNESLDITQDMILGLFVGNHNV